MHENGISLEDIRNYINEEYLKNMLNQLQHQSQQKINNQTVHKLIKMIYGPF